MHVAAIVALLPCIINQVLSSPVSVSSYSNATSTDVSTTAPTSTVDTLSADATPITEVPQELLGQTIVFSPRASVSSYPIDTSDLDSWIDKNSVNFVWGKDLTYLTSWDGVMHARYPAGSRNPASPNKGGLGFYLDPYVPNGNHLYRLSYSVLFPWGFDWVKGGKLPGLYGGKHGCSGGSSAEDCFSTRLMWRKNGQGELYFYAARQHQTSSTCSQVLGGSCDTAYGMSVNRGSFTFPKGQWTQLTQYVRLNTPGKANGYFALYVNGEKVIELYQLYYRSSSNTKLKGIMFDTFFGGNDESWSPSSDQTSMFKDISFGYE